MASKDGHRRSWGSGSLMEEKQRSGRVVWIGQVRVAGKQRQKVLGPKSGQDALTKREAERALRAFRDDAEASAASQARAPVREATLRSTATAHLAHLETNDTKASTIADYRGYLQGHLLPFFDDVPLREIRVRDVEAFIAHQRTKAVQNRSGKDGKHKVGFAGSTVSNHVNYLHAIFAFAQRREDVDVNPVTAAAKPRVKKSWSELLVPVVRADRRGRPRRSGRLPRPDGPHDHPDRRDDRTAPRRADRAALARRPLDGIRDPGARQRVPRRGR